MFAFKMKLNDACKMWWVALVSHRAGYDPKTTIMPILVRPVGHSFLEILSHCLFFPHFFS